MTEKKPEVGEVKVTYDPSVIRKPTRTAEEAEKLRKDYNKEKLELVGSNTNSKLGMESSIGKDENKFKLMAAFDRGDVFTTSAGASLLDKAPSTVLKYAKELNIALFDTAKQEWLPGRKPACMDDESHPTNRKLTL